MSHRQTTPKKPELNKQKLFGHRRRGWGLDSLILQVLECKKFHIKLFELTCSLKTCFYRNAESNPANEGDWVIKSMIGRQFKNHYFQIIAEFYFEVSPFLKCRFQRVTQISPNTFKGPNLSKYKLKSPTDKTYSAL